MKMYRDQVDPVRSTAAPLELEAASQSLSEHSLPLYVYTKDSSLNQIGTSFIVCHKARVFLITAAHCVDYLLSFNASHKYSGAVVIAFGKNTYAIEQETVFLVTNKNPKDSTGTLDIATLELTDKFPFYERAKKISICTMRLSCEDLPSNRVSVMGFSNKLNKSPIVERPGGEKTVLGGIQLYVTYPLALDYDMREIGLTNAAHMAIRWPEKDEKGNIVSSPKGLSGGPVWCMHAPPDPESAVLVGLFIEYHKKRRVAAFTKASYILKFIEHTYF